ncbi:MAG: flagellar motor protein [Chloroflexota bacterium]
MQGAGEEAVSVQSKVSVDPATAIGLLAGFGCLVVSFIMEGGRLDALMNPSAALIVFGGTLGATLLSSPYRLLLNLPRAIVRAFLPRVSDDLQLIGLISSLADVARRDGLLALESKCEGLGDPFLERGVQLVVDGAEPEVVREVLEVETEQLEARHAANYGVLEAMGGFSPTMGIIGTVMGLINVLGSLSDPSELGPAIAVAFIATLYGVGSANLLWLPLAGKLRKQSEQEETSRQLMLHGLLAIQAGENPRVIREKLLGFLPPSRRAPKQDKAAAQSAMEEKS